MKQKKVLKRKSAESGEKKSVSKSEEKVADKPVAKQTVAMVRPRSAVAEETNKAVVEDPIEKLRIEAREARRNQALIDAKKAAEELKAKEAEEAAAKEAARNEEMRHKKKEEDDRLARKAAEAAKREEDRKKNNEKRDQNVLQFPSKAAPIDSGDKSNAPIKVAMSEVMKLKLELAHERKEKERRRIDAELAPVYARALADAISRDEKFQNADRVHIECINEIIEKVTLEIPQGYMLSRLEPDNSVIFCTYEPSRAGLKLPLPSRLLK